MTIRLALAAALLLVPAAAPSAAAPAPDPLSGVWRNRKDSVRIRVAPCGAGVCGTVIRASAEAEADAAAGGTDRLVGTRLIRDMRRDEDGRWYGEVFVPDLGQTVEGSIDLVDRDTIEASGCLFAGFGCKTQVWTRVRAEGGRRR